VWRTIAKRQCRTARAGGETTPRRDRNKHATRKGGVWRAWSCSGRVWEPQARAGIDDSFGMRNHIAELTLTQELALMVEDSFVLPTQLHCTRTIAEIHHRFESHPTTCPTFCCWTWPDHRLFFCATSDVTGLGPTAGFRRGADFPVACNPVLAAFWL